MGVNDERNKTIFEMHVEHGKSYNAIAVHFGITRNAVSGAINTYRQSTGDTRSRPIRVYKERIEKLRTSHPISKTFYFGWRIERVVLSPALEDVPDHCKPLWALSEGECHYPLMRNAEGARMYCARVTHARATYCSLHSPGMPRRRLDTN